MAEIDQNLILGLQYFDNFQKDYSDLDHFKL